MIQVFTAVFNSDLEKALRTGYFEFQNPCRTNQLHERVDAAFDMHKQEGVPGRLASAIMPLMTEDQAYEFSWLTGAAVLKADLPPEVAVREGTYAETLMRIMLRCESVLPEEIARLANPYWGGAVRLGDFKEYVPRPMNHRDRISYVFVGTHHSTNRAAPVICQPEVLLPEGTTLYSPRFDNGTSHRCIN